jgi:hypothetical protein
MSAVCSGCWLSGMSLLSTAQRVDLELTSFLDPINEYFFGRRAAIFISGVFVLSSVIGGACTHNWQQLLGCRVLLGNEAPERFLGSHLANSWSRYRNGNKSKRW